MAQNKKQLDRAVIVVSLLGLAVAAMWLVVGFSSLSMQVGWYVHLALSAVAWLQLVHVDRTSKLNPQVRSLFVVATMCGLVAYVVSLVRTSDLVLGSLSGLGCVGGGLLILAALTVKRPAKSQPLSPA
ncbi:MAG: hypothetical protein KHZ52_08835 [Actinomyces graevenitzii]|nr:hypothetical protein [Actinomyces graevenitzii]